MWLFRVPVRGMLAVSKCQALRQVLYVPRLIYSSAALGGGTAISLVFHSIVGGSLV